METITLKANDDRLGFVDENRNLVYPAVDVFRAPIVSRTTMQVVRLSDEKFVCFPPRENIENWLAVLASDAVDSAIIDIGADGDRDAEDASPDDPLPDETPDVIEEDVLTEADLSDMTKAELLELATERGLTLSERMTKAHLIEALKP